MRRLFTWLPYLGLLLLALGICLRAFRSEGLDLPEFPRPPKVEFADQVLALGTASLAGRVVDENSFAVAEALVLADLNGELVWDYADARGEFELENLPAGEIRLTVVARKFTTKVWKERAPAKDLIVNLGEPIEPPPSLPEMGESDLTGEVVASISGRGLSGYEVQLRPAQPVHQFGAPIPVRAPVGADRTFRFKNLLHGEYLVVILPKWARGGNWPNLADPNAPHFVHGPTEKRATFHIHAGEIGGRVIDSRGEFIEGALVRATPIDAPTRPWNPVNSDAAGRFLVRDLPPGDYRLQVSAGEALFDDVVTVLAGTTSEVDVAPLRLRAKIAQD